MKRAHRFEVVLPGRELPELLSLLKKDYTSSELDRFSPTQEQEHGDEIERVVFEIHGEPQETMEFARALTSRFPTRKVTFNESADEVKDGSAASSI